MKMKLSAFAVMAWTSLLSLSAAQDLQSTNQVHANLDLVDPYEVETNAIHSLEDWKRRRDSIRRNLEIVMGSAPQRNNLSPVEFRILEDTQLDNGLIRQKIEFVSEKQTGNRKEDLVRAILFIHASTTGLQRPGILCLHQTNGIGKEEPAGLGGNTNLHYALELAQRGYVTLAPDYPSFGEHAYDFQANPQWASGSMKAIWDNMRAIDLLQQLPQVDPMRIGCIGHSLGGHNTIFTSFFDERISVAVSSCGFTRFHKYYGGNLKGWTSDRYMPRIANNYSNNPNLVPFDFPELIASIAPRAFFTSSPIRDENFEVSGVRESIDQASKIFKLYSAGDQLEAIYPDSAHDFPPEAREQAYRFIDRILKRQNSIQN